MKLCTFGGGPGRWSYVKAEYPHLLTITNPAVLAIELERVRHEYNIIRLHEVIGYVTPDDEHQGCGEAIRQAGPSGSPPPTRPAEPTTEACHHDHQPSLSRRSTGITPSSTATCRSPSKPLQR